jgi:hypothetical protein
MFSSEIKSFTIILWTVNAVRMFRNKPQHFLPNPKSDQPELTTYMTGLYAFTIHEEMPGGHEDQR